MLIHNVADCTSSPLPLQCMIPQISTLSIAISFADFLCIPESTFSILSGAVNITKKVIVLNQRVVRVNVSIISYRCITLPPRMSSKSLNSNHSLW